MSKSWLNVSDVVYDPRPMPQIWAESIEQHKRQTIARIIDATVALVADKGLGATSMSQVAERSGIGRATLYSYFPDVEHILLAWHEQEVDRYRESLSDEHARQTDTPGALRVIITRLIEGFSGGHTTPSSPPASTSARSHPRSSSRWPAPAPSSRRCSTRYSSTESAPDSCGPTSTASSPRP